MIVQPTPTNPPTRRRRAVRWAGLMVPPLLLAMVLLAGFAGPHPAATPVPKVAQAGTPSPDASAADGPLADLASAIPTMFGDLEAVSPSEALDTDANLPPQDAIAVVGYFAPDADSQCIDGRPGAPFGPWCDRRGILADSAWPDGPGTDPLPRHLRVHIPIGVRLPSAIEGAAKGAQLESIPVLVVGRRSVRNAACDSTGPLLCDDELEVDRVAWAAGAPMGLTPLVDDRLATARRPNPFVTALDPADLPLVAVLVWPEDVWRLDTDAGAIAQAGTPGQPVWFLRAIDGARGPTMDRQVRWMLLAEPDLRVLASGRPGTGATASLDRG